MMAAEQLKSQNLFFSLYEETRAMFSYFLNRPENVVAEPRKAPVAVVPAYDLVAEIPQGQEFDPANCYVFKRVKLSA